MIIGVATLRRHHNSTYVDLAMSSGFFPASTAARCTFGCSGGALRRHTVGWSVPECRKRGGVCRSVLLRGSSIGDANHHEGGVKAKKVAKEVHRRGLALRTPLLLTPSPYLPAGAGERPNCRNSAPIDHLYRKLPTEKSSSRSRCSYRSHSELSRWSSLPP